MSYRVILSAGTLAAAQDYAKDIAAGEAVPGQRLSRQLPTCAGEFHPLDLLQRLLNTKSPQIFAESAVYGDGTDWNQREMHLLGDIAIAADVEIFDDGRHHEPSPHVPPFSGTLVFTCGALLRNRRGHTTADLAEIARNDVIDPSAYTRLYARRLMPVLTYIQETASKRGRRAIVTIPGLGCGQFAGAFRGTLGPLFQRALTQMISDNHALIDRISLVFLDPYAECSDLSLQRGATRFRVRPLCNSRHPRPQLCRPVAYAEAGDDFGDCDLYSLVAWDPVSWPGNDFFVGSRATDDGVKAAATSFMHAISGIEGSYDATAFKYLPPAAYRNWEECVRKLKLTLQLGNPYRHP